MSHDKSKYMQALMHIYPSGDYEIPVQDPLWHSQVMPMQFARNAAIIADSSGFMPFDENPYDASDVLPLKVTWKASIQIVHSFLRLCVLGQWLPVYGDW